MKQIARFFIVVSCILALAGAATAQSQVIKLYDVAKTAETPYILVMKNGDIMVHFTEGYHINADAELRQMIYSQSTKSWSGPTVPVKRTNSSSFPQLTMDSAGDIHLAYQDGNSSDNREIFYALYSNGAWGRHYVAYESPGVNDTWPRIRVEGDMIYILWTHNYPHGVGEQDVCMVVNKKGDPWPVSKYLRKTVSETGQSVSVHNAFDVQNKNVHAVWMDTNHAIGSGWWAIYYNEGIYNAGANDWGWKTSTRIYPVGDNQYYPAMTMDPSGTVHVIFSARNGPFWHARKVGNTWSGLTQLSTNQTDFTFISFVKYAQGLLHTVWREATANGETLFYGRGLPDGRWAKPIKIADAGGPQYPGLDVDAQGNVHVVWSDGPDDYNRDIYYAKLTLPGSAPNAVIEATPKAGIVPLTVKFDASKSTDADGQIIDYVWEFGDGGKATGKTVTYTYNQKGRFIASLSIIDNDFRVGTSQVEIIASRGEPFAYFEPSSVKGMMPMTVTFDASGSTDVDGQIVSYDWSFGDGKTGSGKVVAYTYSSGGKFNATLTVTDNEGKTDSTSRLITVYQKPTASFTATPTQGIVPLKVDFDASASSDVDGQIVSYKWDFGDGLTAEGKKVSNTYSTVGRYTVILTVTDNDNYTGTAVQWIDVLDKPLPPVNIKVGTVLNKSLAFREYINIITWAANLKNSGLFTISQYRIYRRTKGSGQFAKIGEVSGATLEFQDRKIGSAEEAAGYEYAVSSVDDKGREGGFGTPSGMVSTAASDATKKVTLSRKNSS